MPTFTTPRPILVALDLGIADINVTSGERGDTVVDIRPRHAARPGDVRAAEQTTAEFANDRLTIRGPRPRLFGFGRREPAVDVTIAMPAGSHLDAELALGKVRADGHLGDTRIKIGDGGMTLADVNSLRAETGRGDIEVGSVADRLEVNTGMGSVRVQAAMGPATIKNSYGTTEIGLAAGDVRISAASGNILVGESSGKAALRTAYGDVRVASVVRGSVQLDTAYGQAELGICEGTSAWVDAHTSYGRVLNMLGPHDGAPSRETAEISARTAYGDIAIRRAAAINANGRRVA